MDKFKPTGEVAPSKSMPLAADTIMPQRWINTEEC
jgi:hypothetical protein